MAVKKITKKKLPVPTGKGGREIKSKFTFDSISFELSDKQKLFCMEYIRCGFIASTAAINAGYAPKNAGAQGSYLLTHPEIKKLIIELKKDIGLQLGISAYNIAREYARIGFSDIRQIFDSKGNLINIKDIPLEASANISSIEVFEEYAGKGEERSLIGYTKKVKLYDKVNALDKLAKMMGVDGVTKIAQTDGDGNDIIEIGKPDEHA